jgi:glycosyltransferase involved in cell wall biosynthesis
LLEGLAQTPEVEVHVISCLQHPVKALARLAENIYYHALIVRKWGWLRGGYLGCLYALRQKLRALQPDVVHGQGTERYCALAAAFSRFPNVITIHGHMRRLARLHRSRPFTFPWWQARLESFTLPRVGGVICVSTYTQQVVQPLVPRTWIVPNPVDGDFFEVKRAAEQENIVLCVGLVSLHKNQNALIRAVEPLAAQHRFQLFFLGQANPSDPYAREFFALLADRPWCQHHGFADRGQIRKLLARARLLVLPSIEDNCPMVILEAMAAGVPVVAARVGGVPDLVDHENNGLLCDPHDLQDMRRQVERMVADEPYANRLAQRAKEQARQRFHPLVVARVHAAIYREMGASAQVLRKA